MLRILMATLMLAAAAPSAASTRERLSGFNGVDFGTSLAAAQKQLGPGFKEGANRKDPKLKTLIGHASAFGKKFAVNYSFDAGDKLTTVYTIASVKPGDFAVCKAYWTTVYSGLKDAYGKPDSDQDKLADAWPTQFVTYAFKDGASVEASIIGCLILVNYLSPTAKR